MYFPQLIVFCFSFCVLFVIVFLYLLYETITHITFELKISSHFPVFVALLKCQERNEVFKQKKVFQETMGCVMSNKIEYSHDTQKHFSGGNI